MKIRNDYNRYSTPISVHKCDTCGTAFSVCPPIPDGAKGWDGCMDIDCKSYDSDRDANKLFDNGVAIKRAPLPRAEA